MTEGYTMRQAAKAADLPSHFTLERWIKDDVFEPKHNPEPPTPRRFSLTEVIQIGAMQRLRRLGVPLESASRATQIQILLRFTDGPAFLALWIGTHKFSDDRSREGMPDGSSVPSRPVRFDGPFAHFVGGIPDYGHRIVRGHLLDELKSNPRVEGVVYINLDEVEASVKAKLAELTGEASNA